MRRRVRGWLLLAVGVSLVQFAGCRSPFASALDPHPLDPIERGEYRGPEPEFIGEQGARAEEVRLLAQVFYTRIINRRFNSIATNHDPALRELFVSPEAFADYFAALSDALSVANFKAMRPTGLRVEQIDLAEVEVALVTVRFRGRNSRPLRFSSVELIQTDRWEFRGGRWWIIPGKL